jgi:hypothetical protein
MATTIAAKALLHDRLGGGRPIHKRSRVRNFSKNQFLTRQIRLVPLKLARIAETQARNDALDPRHSKR